MLIVYLLLILMILLWSFSFIVVDIAVDYIPPLSIALYRFIISSMGFITIDIYIKFKGKKESDNSNFQKKK
ncbi:MAG: EamA family transporter [Promethearchaeota archaeon]